jgi:hypothetical protein
MNIQAIFLILLTNFGGRSTQMAVCDVCDAVSSLLRGQDRSNEITSTDLFTVFLPVSGRIQLQVKTMNCGKIRYLLRRRALCSGPRGVPVPHTHVRNVVIAASDYYKHM